MERGWGAGMIVTYSHLGVKIRGLTKKETTDNVHNALEGEVGPHQASPHFSPAEQAQLECTNAPRVSALAQLPYHRHISPVGVFVHRASDEVRYDRHVSLIKRFKHYNANLYG